MFSAPVYKMDFVDKKEQSVFEQFKKITHELGQDDKTLLRFLRARDCDIRKAEETLKKSVEWRKDNQVSTYVNWRPPKLIEENFLFECSGLDNEGHAVMYVPAGSWRIRDMIAQNLKEDCLRFRFHILENFIEYQKKTSRDQFSIIIDTAEMTYWKVAHIETIQVLLACFRDFEVNYPERLKQAFVINTPWVFSYIYAFLKPLLSSHTLGKVQIFDSDQTKWKPAMLNYMPESSLPKVYQP